MNGWAELAQQVRDLLLDGRGNEIGPLLDSNFDLRMKNYQMSEGNTRMVQAARACGASAKFTGSGGAIVGTYEGEDMFKSLESQLKPLGLEVIKPLITESAATSAQSSYQEGETPPPLQAVK